MASALLALSALGAACWGERSRRGHAAPRTLVREETPPDRLEYHRAGLYLPPTRPAERAGLDVAEEVIGIEVGGKARAYRLNAMRDRSSHIINDLVAGVPVTVTYCDLADCARVFAGPSGGAPLDVSQAGLKGERMVLQVGGFGYLQDTGEPLDPGATRTGFPYPAIPATRTLWGAWRAAHPHTDLVTGDQGDGRPY